MEPANIVLMVVVLAISISAHESAHGYIAEQCGDKTARAKGRITMNPIAHIDPMWTILLPALMIMVGAPPIGAAKPVPVNPANLKRPKRDQMYVSLAGPLSNFTLAFLGIFLLTILAPLLVNKTIPAAVPLGKLLAYTVIINILLAIFNLIPVPPLDGEGVLQYYLKPSQVRWMRQNRMVLMGALLILFMFGFLGLIIQPFIQLAYYIQVSATTILWGSETAQLIQVFFAF